MDYLSDREKEEIEALKRYVAALEASGKHVRLFKYGVYEGKECREPIPTVVDAGRFLTVADVSCYGQEVGIEVRFGEPDEQEREALRQCDALKPASHVHPGEPRVVEGMTVVEFIKSHPPAPLDT